MAGSETTLLFEDEPFEAEPLNSASDWSIWRIRMEDFLVLAGLWEYVSGERERTNVENPSDSDTVAWDPADQKALDTIRTNVGRAYKPLLRDAKRSREAWDRLKKHFEARRLGRVLDIRCELRDAHYEEGESLQDWLMLMLSYQEDLIELGYPLPEEDFALMLLMALPPSWRAFVNKIPEVELEDSGAIISRIREHGELISLMRDTRFARNQTQPRRRNKTRKPRNGTRTETIYTLEKPVSARVDPDAWMADSKTAVHVARERRLFANYTPLRTGERLRGALIRGTGTVQLILRAGSREKTVRLIDVLHVPDAPQNLVAIKRVEAAGHNVRFGQGRIWFEDRKGVAYATGRRVDVGYRMDGRVYEV